MLTKVDVKDILRRSLPIGLIFLVPLLAFTFFLSRPIPYLGNITNVEYTFIGWIPVVAIVALFYVTLRIPGWLGTLVSLTATVSLFSLPLAGMWSTGASGRYVIAGLLQISDAGGYYHEALRIVEGDVLTAWGSRRPMFLAMLAALLKLLQQNLQLTLAVLLLMVAIACFFCAREVQRSYGTISGALALSVLFLFIRPLMGQTVTETLGLSLGCFGLGLLLSAIRQEHRLTYFLGLWLLTLALVTRAGAFFILPAITLWGAIAFRGSRFFSWPFFLAGSSAVVSGFLCNSLLLKVVGSRDAISFSNYGFALYSLVTGNRWNQILVDYPELNTLEDAERGQRVMELTLQMLYSDPSSLVAGSLRAWTEFLWGRFPYPFFRPYIFSMYTGDHHFSTFFTLSTIFGLLSILGLIVCAVRWRNPLYSFLIASFIGIVVSIPFIPPWAEYSTRVHAATVAFCAILPAIGLAAIIQGIVVLIRKLRGAANRTNGIEYHESSFPLALPISSVTLALFTVIGPIATWAISQPTPVPEINCPTDAQAVYFRKMPGSVVHVHRNRTLDQSHLPNLRVRDFRTGFIHEQSLPEDIQLLKDLSPPISLIPFTDLSNFGRGWLTVKTQNVPEDYGKYATCAQLETVNHFQLYHAESFQLIQ